jgi:uncharacterized protein with HEPN domain
MLLDPDKNRLRHMIEAAEQAIHYAEQHSRDELHRNPPLYHLFIRNLEILGEAASRISSQVRHDYPDIPWRDMVDMRNRLIHVYFDIDLDVVWTTVHDALPRVLSKLRAVLETENQD